MFRAPGHMNRFGVSLGVSFCVRLCVGWLVVCGLAASVSAAAPIHYVLTVDAPHTHYVQVEARMVPKSAGDLDLFLPVWTPGSYMVREYARHLDSFEVTDAAGKTLEIQKTSKNHWKVAGAPVEGIKLRYRVYCNELSVRTNFVDAEFAILAGAATFVTAPSMLGEEHTVQLVLPKQWQQSVTPLEHPVNEAAHFYRAANYDELVDSPILLGNPRIVPFRVGQVEHFLVHQGTDPLWNVEAAAADAAKIVSEHQRMWQQVPYDRYYFFNLVAEGGGGLEHSHSTVLLTNRWTYRNDKNYKKWLGLVSHEFFHTWNVRRLRPQSLARYDYDSEVYVDELWVAEGITSYYEELALVRAGLLNTPQYLSTLSKQIETLQSASGREHQSLRDASHDAWIKFYRPDENSANTSISYYNKGAILGFLLDIAIRKQTNNERSLDDVMRVLYERYANKQGFTNRDVLLVANEVSGSDMSEWFNRAVNTTSDLDYTSALAWLGLEFKAEAAAAEPKSDSSESKGAVPSTALPPTAQPSAAQPSTASTGPWLGIVTETKEGKLLISRVQEGSPAFAAGLNYGDELIGISGYRLNEPLEERLKYYQVGETIDVLLSRRGKLHTISVVLQQKPPASWNLKTIKEPAPQQVINLNRWLKPSKTP